MAERIIDPLFSSGLQFAQSIAGGENVADMIAPGVGYSEEFPEGFVMRNGVPVSVREAAPMPAPTTMPEMTSTQVQPSMLMDMPMEIPDSAPSPTNIPFIDAFNIRLATPPRDNLLITPEEEMAAQRVRDLIQSGDLIPPAPVFGSGLPMSDGQMAMFDAEPERFEMQPQYNVDAQPIKYRPFDFTNVQRMIDRMR
tara:strand:+ start:1615 stop:2202 length:588 start_codon:yes stop_codon:yes gene_type:complete